MTSDKWQLPALQEEEIREIFNEFDVDRSGEISIDEFEDGVKRLQLPLSQSDIARILHVVDTNADGKITFDEFKQFALSQDRKIRRTFDELDINKDRVLSPSEIRRALKSQLDLEISNQELTSFIHVFSDLHDSSKEILFHQFRERVLLLPAINTRYIYEIYRPTLSIDIGESYTVPADEDEDATLCKREFSKLNIFVSGGICGAISRTATAPADRLKVMLQSGALEGNTKIWDIVRNILNEGGLKSFWRGNGANVVKIAPESAVKFASYDILKKQICQYPDNPKMYERFLAGGIAGGFAQTVIYPLEIAKTRLALASTGEYNGILHCLRSIASERGIGALYRGWTASVIGIIPYAGVDLMVYNTIKDMRARQKCRIHGHQQYRQGQPSGFEILLTGSVSSICGQIVAYPMQVVRTKLQSQGQCIQLKLADGTCITKQCPMYDGFVGCCRSTLLQDGVRGFYKGILPNFAKSVPAISISYLVFEKSKQLLANFF